MSAVSTSYLGAKNYIAETFTYKNAKAFGSNYVFPVVMGAAIGSMSKYILGRGAILPGAAIGAIQAAISTPLDRVIFSLAYEKIENYTGEDKMAYKKRIYNFANTALLVSRVATHALVWGEAALLGVVSLPLAAVAAGVGISSTTVTVLKSVLANNNVLSLQHALWVAMAAQVAIIGVGAFALASLGIVTPLVAIGTGIVLGAITLTGAMIREMKLSRPAGLPAVTVLPINL